MDLLMEYCKNGDFKNVKRLVEEHNVDPTYHSCLLLSAKNGHFEILQYLLDRDCCPNFTINWAAKHGKLDIIKFIVENCDYYTLKELSDISLYCILHTSIKYGQTEVVKYLIKQTYKKSVNKYHYTQSCIEKSIGFGQVEIINVFVEQGYKLTETDEDYIFSTNHVNVQLYVLHYHKNKLLTFMHCILNNKYLKMDILKMCCPYFSEKEIMSML